MVIEDTNITQGVKIMYPLDKIEVSSKKELTKILAPKVMQKHMAKVSKSFSIEKAILALSASNTSGAPVVDESNKLLGFISESDLLIQVSHKDKSEKVSYNTKVHKIEETMNLKDIVVFMSKNKLKVAPVISKDNEVLGLISRMDLLKFIVNY
jgi:CBS domain-containing protein